MRNFQKIKTIDDYQTLDAPVGVWVNAETPYPNSEIMMVLRMLVRPKYGSFIIPRELLFLERIIKELSNVDYSITGIKDSWCYVTIRHGIPNTVTDDEWHFDGSSFRTDIIPERNYIWVDHSPTEYKVGKLEIPFNFDPVVHNLFTFAAYQLRNKCVYFAEVKKWHMLSPFVLHRRPSNLAEKCRTFYRICFTDIEGRDINNTPNPLLPTPFFGRDPVKTFRNKLKNYNL